MAKEELMAKAKRERKVVADGFISSMAKDPALFGALNEALTMKLYENNLLGIPEPQGTAMAASTRDLRWDMLVDAASDRISFSATGLTAAEARELQLTCERIDVARNMRGGPQYPPIDDTTEAIGDDDDLSPADQYLASLGGATSFNDLVDDMVGKPASQIPVGARQLILGDD